MRNIDKFKVGLIVFIQFTCFAINGQNNNINLTGIVVNTYSEPIAHAYILYKGLKEYVHTNIDGEFSLSIPNKKIKDIWVGSPGYLLKRINISQNLKNSNKLLKIELESESYLINEVVIPAKRLYDGKRVIVKAFNEINSTFINSNFTSDIYILQTIKEDKTIKKYREAFYSVFHKSGYSKLLKSNRIKEKVYSGQIRETKDFSVNKQQPDYPSISNHYWFFYYDLCKYKPELLKNLNNYSCYIIDSLEKDDLMLINCKQLKDTIAGKSRYNYKTDYLISISLKNNIIRSITETTSFYYKEFSKQKWRRRVFSTLIRANYTPYQNNNYLSKMTFDFIDKGIISDTLGNTIKNKSIYISTFLKTNRVNIDKRVKIKESIYPVYSENFWKDKSLHFNRNFYCKKMFNNGKVSFSKN